MKLEEAREWLAGNRSHINVMLEVEPTTESRPETLAQIERADAATTERAYWIVRAYKEGLLDG